MEVLGLTVSRELFLSGKFPYAIPLMNHSFHRSTILHFRVSALWAPHERLRTGRALAHEGGSWGAFPKLGSASGNITTRTRLSASGLPIKSSSVFRFSALDIFETTHGALKTGLSGTLVHHSYATHTQLSYGKGVTTKKSAKFRMAAIL